jgi:hypothetical protein
VPASNRSRCAMSDEFAKSLYKLPDPTKYPQPQRQTQDPSDADTPSPFVNANSEWVSRQ